MNFDKLGGSNNFIVWILVIFIVVGFGSCSKALGIDIFKVNDFNDGKRSRKHHKDDFYYTKSVGVPIFGGGGFNKVLGGNGLFIILVIALLILCKDKKEECDNKIVDMDEEIDCSL